MKGEGEKMKGTVVACLLAILCSVVHGANENGSKRPHILFIMADDVGFADVGYKHHIIPTPVIDGLVQESISLEKYYVHPVCTPTRASFLTGRYASAVGMPGRFLVGVPHGLSRDHETIAESLQGRGYRTLMSGKWHVGHAALEHTPTHKGFERFFGFYSAAEGHHSKRLCIPFKDGYDLRDQEKAVINTTHSSDLYSAKLMDMISEHARGQADEPLFMYLSFAAAHSPLQPAAEDLAQCAHVKTDVRRRFCGLVAGMDRAIGNVIRHLQQLDMYQHTVIAFSSDNGGQPWQGGRNYPLRGSKLSVFEGGSRAISFVRLPDRTLDQLGVSRAQLPSVYNGLMHVSDWKKTLESVADLTVHCDGRPETLGPPSTDGMDLFGCLVRNESSPRRDVLMHYDVHSSNRTGYRLDDFKYVAGSPGDSYWYDEPVDESDWVVHDASFGEKLVEMSSRALSAMLGNEDCLMTYDELLREALHWCQEVLGHNEAAEQLFHLPSDPYERHDVAAQHPDVLAMMRERVRAIAEGLPEQKNWMGVDLAHRLIEEEVLLNSCNGPHCRTSNRRMKAKVMFHGPWVDNMEGYDPTVVNMNELGPYVALAVLAVLLFCVVACLGCWRVSNGSPPIKSKCE